jgi:hypothetical protein
MQFRILGFAAFLSVSSFASGEAAGIIAKLKGEVSVQSGKVTRKPKEDEKFYVGDTFITGYDGRVKLRFAEGGSSGKNEVVIGKSSRFFVEKAGSSTAKTVGTQLLLKEGTVRSVVRRKYSGQGDDIFQVRTPNAVAGVRGTVFIVGFDPKNQISTVLTQQGNVSFDWKGAQQIVAAGQVVKASPKQPAQVESYKKDPTAIPEGFRDIAKEFGEKTDPELGTKPGSGGGSNLPPIPPPLPGTDRLSKPDFPAGEKPKSGASNSSTLPADGGPAPIPSKPPLDGTKPPMQIPPPTTTPYLPPVDPSKLLPPPTDPTKLPPPPNTTAPPPYQPPPPPPTTSPGS